MPSDKYSTLEFGSYIVSLAENQKGITYIQQPIFNNIPLRTRKALSPKTLYSDSALLILNGTLLNSDNTLLALN